MQIQISRYATNTSQLFHFSDVKNRDELVRMVVVDHLPFSFDKKLSFINYYKNALNPQATKVLRITLTCALHKLIKKKKNYKIFLSLLMGAYLYVAIYGVITNNNILIWGSLVIGLIMNGIYKKRVIAFRVFDERHL